MCVICTYLYFITPSHKCLTTSKMLPPGLSSTLSFMAVHKCLCTLVTTSSFCFIFVHCPAISWLSVHQTFTHMTGTREGKSFFGHAVPREGERTCCSKRGRRTCCSKRGRKDMLFQEREKGHAVPREAEGHAVPREAERTCCSKRGRKDVLFQERQKNMLFQEREKVEFSGVGGA